MASSADDQPKIELVRPAASRDPAAPTSPHPALSTDEQPALGYPPVIGYPPGDPRGPGPYAYPYPAPAPPIHGPYPDPGTSYGQRQVEWRRLSRFTRGALLAISIFVVLLLSATIIIQMALHPRMPNFLLSGFSVSHLSISNDSVLLANWEANVVVENRNSHIRLELPLVWSFIYHRDPQRYLSLMKYNEPLTLGKKSRRVIDLKMMTSASEQPDTRVVNAVRNELDSSNKKVNFSLAMEVAMKFKYSWWWKKGATMMVYCGDLVVEFDVESGFGFSGSLAGNDKPRKCLLLSN
ncbi:uncharacterized protein LOC116193982 [Punica granatum]|uniref:Late embryogenesis abundant protein LEA-2 subgroup domain-containing protein n=2 Tax=Punica granatum TaxID=22663 RepID=A0A218X2K5_PUNGR|nr:uncharacterized protein LOC116193982 [Punica granatum]OWM79038.1 hypothetical protein CDL15_Pgr003209 [Punica granatum]PKI37542.1 hypothetical protein CRG98_042055 [Punica granatum]